MSTTFFIGWGAILVFSGLLMAWLKWAATRSPRFARYRERPPQVPPLDPTLKAVNVALNNTLSLVLYAAFFWFLGERLIAPGWPGATAFLGEVLGVLLLYDLMYYFFHRGMHVRGVMRYCHAVHHRVRSPLPDESIFVHPLELIGGLGLLGLALAVLGPVSAPSFLAIVFVHSTVNIIVHSNLRFPHPALRLFNFWVEKHNVHHQKARNNYASIFPFWDQAFGTSE
jgi:sterol desaturase/sphingolipid hydroxylase (fatty acid hydroxylase superfamily)